MTDYIVPCTHTITAKDIGYLLCGEFEGNYMATWIGRATAPNWKAPKDFHLPWYADEEFIADPDFRFSVEYDQDGDDEGDCSGAMIVDRAAIIRGLTLMAEKYPNHWADLVNDDGNRADAVTYDVAMQCIVLGDVIYG